MSQLILSFIEDKDNDPVLRSWAFVRFGDFGKATYTMFEATFTSTWTQSSRKLVEEVNAWYGLFWVLYVVGVNFAVMRVIAALFLKQTMAVASQDAEKMIMAKMKER